MIQTNTTTKTEQQFAVKAVPATVKICVLTISDLTAPSSVKVSGATQKAATF